MPAQDVHDRLNDAAEAFLQRLRRGETPSISEYAQRYPELADDIRDLFPTLAMVEGLGERAADGNGAASQPPEVPHQLGDYHVVREIGRGGMGVVYEAYQKPLGRKVALKVLRGDTSRDRVRLLRFQREARVAARLHHTNIVPVHEVGVRDGVHYYSMQYIEGQGLDSVWAELRRNRDGEESGTPRGHKSVELTRRLADGLLTEAQTGVDRAGRGHEEPDQDASPTPPANRPAAGADSTSGVQNLIDTAVGSRVQEYYRNVARVVLQVVEALAYAHGQGVLHRDIKPANVILDTRGRAWVTDFGLAKKADDELTQTGDIVGTLRYMSPERFRGPGDQRSDVYSAGLTLYEFLTLQPAYAASQRASLLQQIQQGQPPRPRKVEPAIPRDLETIVLKAIDKDPKRRYQTAAALSEDLERFLDDRPIVARRTSALEHAWRWCRRNRAVAALAASVVALLAAVMLIVFIGLARSANVQHQHAVESDRLKRLAERRLLDSYRNEARAWRFSRQVGQRVQGLEAVRSAAALLPRLELSDAEQAAVRRELTDAAINCLALRDLKTLRELPRTPPGTTVLAFDHELARYALAHDDGRVTIHSLTDNRQVAELPSTHDLVFEGRFSPNGRFLVTRGMKGKRHAYVWDVDDVRRIVIVEIHKDGFPVDFTSDSRRVAIGCVDKTVALYNVKSGELLESIDLKPQTTAYALRFSPDDSRLAVTLYGRGRVRIWDFEKQAWERLDYEGTSDIDWSRDGSSLATADGHRVFVWDAVTGRRRFRLHGHQDYVRLVGFSPRGDVLASYAWDGRVWLWNAKTGAAITNMPGQLFGFNRQGKFAYALKRLQTGWDVTVCKLLGGGELTTLCEPLAPGQGPGRVQVHPGGRLMASSGNDGVRLWDLDSGQPVKHPIGALGKASPHYAALFTPEGKHLITSGASGVKQWPLELTTFAEGLEVRIGEPITLFESATADRADLSGDGKRLAMLDEGARGRSRLIGESSEQPSVFLIPGDTSHVAISPNGRRAAVSHHYDPVDIWDTESGKLVHKLPESTAHAALSFSPDGRWLVTATADEYRFWESGTWSSSRAIARSEDASGHNAPAAFSRDGRIMAIAHGKRAVKLIRTDTLADLATLEPPVGQVVTWMHFTPNGHKLLVASSARHAIYVWDLRAIGKRLRELKLAWDMPQ